MNRLPEELRPYIGESEPVDRSGHSNAKSFETCKGFFVKCDAPGELEREYRMTRLFHRFGFGPEPVRYITLDRDYLVTRRADGEDMTKDLRDPVRACRTLADALRTLHAHPAGPHIPVSSRYARYAESAEGPDSGGFYDPSVYTQAWRCSSKGEAWKIMQKGKRLLKCDTLIHGDACLPNVMQKNGRFSSFVDLSMAGLGDRHIDLYWAVWSLEYNLKTDRYADVFLDAYGRDLFSEDMFRVVAAFEAFG
ncbi:MAG: phosphotransferase [Clostridia bacterium]|nr:phosphotransferase [Clostridia bacterium]